MDGVNLEEVLTFISLLACFIIINKEIGYKEIDIEEISYEK
jgi:hypothetical protein